MLTHDLFVQSSLIELTTYEYWSACLTRSCIRQLLVTLYISCCILLCDYMLLQIYKEDCLDLLVPPSRRDKDQLTIREDVAGGIKVSNVVMP